MKKMTLLEMVQNIASALDTDEVNSITDTTESLQIAEVIKETYYEQFNNIFVAESQGLFALDSVSDVDSPNYLRVPPNVSKIKYIKYRDYRAGGMFGEVTYVSPETFLDMQLQFPGPDDGLSETTDPSSGVVYYVQNNAYPTYFTLFDDDYIAFNSYDSDYETTMQGINSIGFGTLNREFEMEDDFVPHLDGSLFPLLLAEAKSTCFINIKQVASSKEEQKARRQRIRMQNDQFRARQAQYNHWNSGPDFSRRGR